MSYGCYNRQPFAPHQRVQDGYIETSSGRIDRIVDMPHAMTKDCQYTHSDLGQADAGCKGCTWTGEKVD